MAREVRIGPLRVGGGQPLAFIGGTCMIESRDSALRHAEAIRDICAARGLPFIYKSSFDKANRTSLTSPRGPGLDAGLRILAEVKREVGVPVVTDVHELGQAKLVAEVADLLQTPAFLCRQTDFLLDVAGAGKPVNVKKGQFLAPWDIGPMLEKVASTGNRELLVTERGASFGYNTLVSDMRALPIMAGFGAPVVFDATHSVQQPGGMGASSGGDREMVPYLARAAVAVGVACVFMEVHQDPDHAPSDGPNMVKLKDFPSLLEQLVAIDAITKRS